MTTKEEYILSRYQDLGALENGKKARLKRERISGLICVEKRVSQNMRSIYEFLKNNSTPYIPRVYECIEMSEQHELLVIEEYISGRTLEDIVSEHPIEELEAVRIGAQICEALKVLHHAVPPIICRDLKAENVMIGPDGYVKIVDFNIARIYRDGQRRDTLLMGTAEYAAPEQFGFFQTDNRTDIYALGVLLNYMAIGKFPVEQLVRGSLAQVVRKCTCLEPDARYQSVEEMEREFYRLYSRAFSNAGAEKLLWSAVLGFRSRTWWKMILSSGVYLYMTFVLLTTEYTREGKALPGYMQRIEGLLIWASQAAFIVIVGNHRGWSIRIPLLSSRNKQIRIIGYVILEFVLLLLMAMVCICLENILL